MLTVYLRRPATVLVTMTTRGDHSSRINSRQTLGEGSNAAPGRLGTPALQKGGACPGLTRVWLVLSLAPGK